MKNMLENFNLRNKIYGYISGAIVVWWFGGKVFVRLKTIFEILKDLRTSVLPKVTSWTFQINILNATFLEGLDELNT